MVFFFLNLWSTFKIILRLYSIIWIFFQITSTLTLSQLAEVNIFIVTATTARKIIILYITSQNVFRTKKKDMFFLSIVNLFLNWLSLRNQIRPFVCTTNLKIDRKNQILQLLTNYEWNEWKSILWNYHTPLASNSEIFFKFIQFFAWNM